MNALLSVLLAVAASARAQNAPPPNVERAPQEAAQRREAGRAAVEAEAASEKEVSFEQILKAPGDLDLNERFAREQIRRGDLRGAATTLERILILAPGRDRTRVLYAAVLYRLGSFADAERELRVVLARPISDDVKSEARKYLSLAASGQRKTHFEARVSLGFGYDDNRNSAADSGQNLFFDQPIQLNKASQRQEDTNVNFAGSLGAAREFGGAEPKRVFGRVSYYRGEQTLVNVLDLQAYSADAGVTLRALGIDATAAGGFDHVLLSQSTYLRDPWEDLRLSKKVRPGVELWIDGRHEDQRFVRTREVVNATDRSGHQWDFAAGASWVLTPRDRFGATLGHRRKLAQAVAQAYRRESAGIDYTRLLGRGMFLSAGITGQFDRYDRPDPTISSQGRQDDAFVLDLMYGAPLSLLWKPLDGLVGTLGFERYQANSNLLNYDYSNDRLSAMLNYRWGN